MTTRSKEMNPLLQFIESADFSAEVSAQSGFYQFLNGLRTHVAVETLADAVQRQRSHRAMIVSRVLTIADQRIDMRYEHPADTALAVYLLVLASVDEKLFEITRSVVGMLPNCWWASRIASKSLTTTTAESREECVSVRNSGAPEAVSSNMRCHVVGDGCTSRNG